MSDNDLERIRMKKAEMMIKLQKIPKEIIKVHSNEEFNKLLTDYPDKIIVIDFWAVWCGPCIAFAPVFERLQQEFSGNFIFAKVNVDEIGSIAQRFGITGIPTTLFIKEEQVIQKVVGSMNYNSMKQILENLNSI
jgi:thioredoxin 1